MGGYSGNQQKSFNQAVRRLMHLYILHRTYLTPICMAKYKPDHNPLCPRCGSPSSTFFHLIWACSVIPFFVLGCLLCICARGTLWVPSIGTWSSCFPCAHFCLVLFIYLVQSFWSHSLCTKSVYTHVLHLHKLYHCRYFVYIVCILLGQTEKKSYCSY